MIPFHFEAEIDPSPGGNCRRCEAPRPMAAER